MKKAVVKHNILLLTFLFCFVPCAFASDYNNDLVKMDLNQSGEDSVKLNIYTNKPYNEKVIVNKKGENKYVILLPETSNTMNVKPDFSGISSVKSVDVKTQQYSSLPNKGYTKIVIDSKYPINIEPQTFVTKKTTPKRTVTTTQNQQRNRQANLTPQQVQMSLPQRVLHQSKPVTNNDFVPAYERQRQYNEQQRQYSQNSLQNYAQNVSQQPQKTTIQTLSNQSVLQQTTVTSNAQVVRTTDESALTENERVALEDNAQTQALDDNTTKQEINDNDISDDDLALFKKIISVKQRIKNKLRQIKQIKNSIVKKITFSSIVTILQFALLIVLIKIISDLVKKLQATNTEKEEVKPKKRLLLDDDETNEPMYPSYSNMDMYNTNRSNFEEDNKEGFNVNPLANSVSYKSKVDNIYSNPIHNSNLMYQEPKTQEYVQRNDFYRPLNEINEEEKMSIFDENAEDIEKTIFKNPLTPISKQAEETLFDDDDEYESKDLQNSPFENNDYMNKEQEEFFNYNSHENEEDFFIFEDEDNNNEVIENYNENEYSDISENDDVEDEYYEDEYSDEEYDDDEYEYEYVEEDDEDENDDEIIEEKAQPSENVSEQQTSEVEIQKPVEQTNPFDHLKVQSKYVIDSARGFAHVNVDGINALIGYVGSKITIIRKFKEDIKDKMQVRLNEQADENTLIYIVKLGKYKTLVEVKPNSIRQLLDL